MSASRLRKATAAWAAPDAATLYAWLEMSRLVRTTLYSSSSPVFLLKRLYFFFGSPLRVNMGHLGASAHVASVALRTCFAALVQATAEARGAGSFLELCFFSVATMSKLKVSRSSEEDMQ